MKELEIVFSAQTDVDTVRYRVISFVREQLRTDKSLLEIAVIEAVNNAILHGAGKSGNQLIRVRLRTLRNKILLVRVKDCGDGFPGNRLLKKIRESKDELFEQCLFNESGRGVLIMSRAADCILYNQQGNEVLMTKRIPTASQCCG